ncbi:netrin receptor UNC5B-like [Stylophora pistillata]|uniref:netrin receptor UNC5B-like n=1 Tax=Stylophora pistillata TaxID=50429 RepID=UPI000C03A8D8|nr:netrin receptor UNC5B-like [Stylophora pistillata]
MSSASGVYTEQTEASTRSKYTEEDETEDTLPTSNPIQYILPSSESNLVVADVHHSLQFDEPGTRSPRYITEAQAKFDSSGGKLSAPDSDVVITVGSGAVPEGREQPFFFRVPKYDSTLLQDISEMPEGRLISPVIECGPHGLTLLKPVEITVPHDLCLDEVRKDWIRVYRCEPSSQGPLKWEKVPPASEKNCRSKAWFTVKKNSIQIKTTTFSIWSVFACGGTKRKRGRVYYSKHDSRSEHIYLRFYIYSDNEDSKKRVKEQEKESFPNSKPSREKPFKMNDDEKDVIVKLTDLQDGWELDKTPSEQRYDYETAYRNGFRAKDACDFAVKPVRPGLEEFSCYVRFKQEGSATEYSIYLYPCFTPRQTGRKIIFASSGSDSPTNGGELADSVSIIIPEENEINGSQETTTSLADSQTNQTEYFSHDIASLGSDRQPVTEEHFNCIRGEIGLKWKDVLRKLGLSEPEIENVCVNHREYGVEEMFYQSLLKWKKHLGVEATTEKLCDVLREVRCTGALKKFRGVVECDAAAPVQKSAASPWTTV